ncbi:SET domain-containing protein [Pyrenophora teres f. teres]|uniref:SET domain-containing protein n=1 Tax=Pyrenophora teres f. teres TaxID=97479 RepID=A0A6S6WF77_9PLEO|nr:SET domain-containing protein [Pyrenophora teres f. teres]
MVKLTSLPTFTYTKQSSTGTGTRSRTATYTHKNKKLPVRVTAHNVIELRKWRAQDRPSYWPSHLTWPKDIAKSLVYSVPREVRTAKKTTTKTATTVKRPSIKACYTACQGLNCPNPLRQNTKRTDPPCTCTRTSHASLNDPAWFGNNVRLEQTASRGIGAIALSPFAVDTVIGEYVGELVPAEGTPGYFSAYLFETRNSREMLGNIDALRVGSWTRFINHSCDANLAFELYRVGGEVRVLVTVKREVAAGEELTVNYGKDYWKGAGVGKCRCGEEGCIGKK